MRGASSCEKASTGSCLETANSSGTCSKALAAEYYSGGR